MEGKRSDVTFTRRRRGRRAREGEAESHRVWRKEHGLGVAGDGRLHEEAELSQALKPEGGVPGQREGVLRDLV